MRTYTVSRLTRDLRIKGIPVTKNAAYDWLAGRRAPRADTAVAIERISRGAVTVRDIIAHRESMNR